MDQTRGSKLIAGGIALLAFGILATVAIRWDRGSVQATGKADPAMVAASEAAKARAAMPTAAPTPTGDPTELPSAPPQPRVVTKNPIYRVGRLPASRCQEPEYEPTTVANVRAYYAEFVACLDKAWAPAIRKAGFEFVSPKLVVSAGESPSSPCDSLDSVAYYCDGAIYMNASADIKDYQEYDPELTLAYMAFTIGHEYGHHVQDLTGIVAARFQRRSTINGVEATLEESRRLELQASCLSGVYFGADRDWLPSGADWIDNFEYVLGNSEDRERDHGSRANHTYWSNAGFDAADPAACNTYTAGSALVS